jgi:uncharacterized protein (DUF433 family)
MERAIEIVDRGRGPQLSTSRITVQDLVPYLQGHYSYEQIMEIMPVLTPADIQAVERYIQQNYEVVMQQDRRIRQKSAQRTIPRAIEESLRRGKTKMSELRQRLEIQGKQERPV